MTSKKGLEASSFDILPKLDEMLNCRDTLILAPFLRDQENCNEKWKHRTNLILDAPQLLLDIMNGNTKLSIVGNKVRKWSDTSQDLMFMLLMKLEHGSEWKIIAKWDKRHVPRFKNQSCATYLRLLETWQTSLLLELVREVVNWGN